jgi:lipopolysaccharide biosynthesis regulator YciM
MLDLGEDYLRAGLFDRAETLFVELSKESDHTDVALQHLVGIYEQERDWYRATVHNDQFQALTGQSKKVETAHYCCELAEEALLKDDNATARDLLHQALDRDSGCVRSSMLRGRLAMNEGRYAAAISAFQAVAHQDLDFFSEIIEPLNQCYEALGRRGDWVDYLRGMQRNTHSGYVMAALVELLMQQQGPAAALSFIESELQRCPTVLGLKWFIELKLAGARGVIDPDLNALYQISRNMFDESVRYKCGNCGFVGKFLHWHCPSCKRWNTVKPLPDLVLKSNV